ncbi:MAG: class I SAM-dependent RNA methyltransferase [Rhizobiales bacterium]|nr:class I SAM-dependent RNA methyltransferase [Hyphomicrobiales bacterium]
MGRRGEGIAESGGATVFVPYALPGETVEAEVTEGRAAIRGLLQPSPDRIAPFCKHHGQCGGCQLQHWADEPYRAWKLAVVEEALKKEGLEHPALTFIDAHGSGRRRAVFHGRRKSGRVTAGFMKPRSHDVHDIDQCPALVPALAKAPEMSRAFAGVLGDCDVAVTAVNNGIDVAIKAAKVSARLQHLTAVAANHSILGLTLNGEVVLKEGQPVIDAAGAAIPIPPGGFLQATAAGEVALSEFVTSNIGKASHIADLFCGVGPFALRLAKQARVSAFDSDKLALGALAAAARNAQGLKPISVQNRNLFKEPLTAAELKSFDAVVFDPPRAGAEAQSRQLAKSHLKTVIAISCDPQTFARDARILVDGGFKLAKLTAIDQFKWTAHAEIAALFAR